MANDARTANETDENEVGETEAIIDETLEHNTRGGNSIESLSKDLFTQKYKKNLCEIDKPNIEKLKA